MKRFLIILMLLIATPCFSDSESTIGGKTGRDMIIQDEGTSLRPRPYLNFTGSGITCSDSGGKTVCNASSGGGSGSSLDIQDQNSSSVCTGSTCDTLQLGNDFIISGSGNTATVSLTDVTLDTLSATTATIDTLQNNVTTFGNNDANSVTHTYDITGATDGIFKYNGLKGSFEFNNTPVQFFSDSAPTTDNPGEVAFDDNALASGRGCVQVFDGTATVYVCGFLVSDTPSDGQVQQFNTGGTITWETPNLGLTTGTDTAICFSDGTDNPVCNDTGMTFNKTTNIITAGGFESTPVPNPKTIFNDSNDETGADNGIIDLNCPVVAGGSQKCEMTLSRMVNGATVDSLILGNAGGVTIDTLTITSDGTNKVTTDSLAQIGFSGSAGINLTDEAYGTSWNGSVRPATKNALYDKIETISAGATAFDDVGDPDAAVSISMSDGESVTFVSAVDGEAAFTVDMTDISLAGSTTGIVIQTAANDDANFIPLRIFDDSGGTPDELFAISYTGIVTLADSMYMLERADANGDSAGYGQFWVDSDCDPQCPKFTEDGGTDYQLATLTRAETLTNKTLTAPTVGTSLTGSYLTASEILITDGSKNIVSAAVATYPSLAELAHVKGVTSAIQTQIDGIIGGRTNYTLPVQSAKLTGAYVTHTPAGCSTTASAASATIDGGSGPWKLLLDATTDEAAVWQFTMPSNYSSAPTLDIHFAMASGEANEVEFEASIMCYTPTTDTANVDTASFANCAVGTSTTVSATAGEVYSQSITLTDDSCAAGDIVWIWVSTDADDATNDDATGDREVINLEFGYTGS